MRVIPGVQYDDAWWAARRGVPTASEFGGILTPKTMKFAAAADTYIHRLIGDRLDLLYPRPDLTATAAMQHGRDAEPESRRWYEMERDTDTQQVSLCLTDDGRFGCSPDSLVGEDGVLELKNPLPHTHVGYLLAGVLPDAYVAQCHGHLIVTGRKWTDFVSYCPGLPPFIYRVVPDDYTDALRAALNVFHGRYMAAWERIRNLK